MAGARKYVSDYEQFRAYWDYDRNVVDPVTKVASLREPYYWTCAHKHTWAMTLPSMQSRVTKNKVLCAFCAKEKTALGEAHPHLSIEWDTNRNLPIRFSDMSDGSKALVWWSPPCGHPWQTTVQRRTLGASCVFCSGHKTLEGFNDINTTHPELEAKIHPDDRHLARTLSFGSNTALRWVCERGHTSSSRIPDRLRFGCPYCSGRNTISGANDLFTVYPEAQLEWSIRNTQDPSTVAASSNLKLWWTCQTCEHEWHVSPNARWSKSKSTRGCPVCSILKTTSLGEDSLYQFVVSLLPKTPVYSGSRKLLWPMELDIYIPTKNLAIEFNGLYWHSEAHKTRTYHYDKWQACKDKGVQLIQIWEDDWEDPQTQEKVKRLISHKLGLNTQDRIGANKTTPARISYAEASEFLSKNHIQGASKGSLYTALTYENSLVAVMVTAPAPTSGQYYIHRYATNHVVQGGFNKLLKFTEGQTPNIRTWITFADHDVSTGALYEKSGFVSTKTLGPDYKYIYQNKRKHKFNYRKSAFKSKPSLQFMEGKTEFELAKMNRLYRVWDSGKTRYKKEVL